MPQKTFANNELLTAADVNTYLMRQSIPQVTAAQRDAIPAPSVGMYAYVTTEKVLYEYNGTAWVRAGGSGAWTSYTPTFTAATTNPAVGSTGSLTGKYTRDGSTVNGWANVVFGTGMSAGSGVYRVGLPLPAATGFNYVVGGLLVYKASVATRYTGVVQLLDGNNVVMATHTLANNEVSSASYSWASGDFMRLNFTYECA